MRALVSKRQDQIRFVVEQTLSEGERWDAFTSGFSGIEPSDYAVNAYRLQKARDTLHARDPSHPALADLDTKISRLQDRARAASTRTRSRGLGSLARLGLKGSKTVAKFVGLPQAIERAKGLAVGTNTQSVGLQGMGIGQAGGEQGEQRARIT